MTLTNDACCVSGSGSDMNQSNVFHVIAIIVKINNLGMILHLSNVSGLICRDALL